MPTFGEVHHVSLSVRELARSTGWYREILGLEVIREVQAEGFERVILQAPGGVPLLGLTRHDANPGHAFSEVRTGMDHVAFNVASPGELEVWAQRFKVMGVRHSRPRPGLVVFRDPDGIQLELVTT